jgi:hypothetical protein
MKSKANWVILKEGKNRFRFLCKEGEESPWREGYRHFIPKEYATEDLPRTLLCLGDNCPLCKLVDELRKKGSEKQGDMLRAQARFLWPVLFRDAPVNDAGELCIKVYEMPQTVFSGLGKVFQEWGEDFTDKDTGYDVEVIKTSNAGQFTKYEAHALAQRDKGTMTIVKSPLNEEELFLVANSYPDLDAEITPPDRSIYEAIFASILGEPTVTPPSRRAPVTTTPPVPPAPKAAATTVDEGVCDQFGEAYDSEVDECIECPDAEDCKAELAKKSQLRSPRKKIT